MTAPIDRAYVVIEPDLSQFESRTSAGVDAAFGDIEALVKELTSTIDRQFEQMASQVADDFSEIRVAAVTAMEDVSTFANGASDEISFQFGEMGARVDAIFEEMQLAADRDMTQMAEHAEVAGSKISESFGKALGFLKLGAGAAAAGLGAVGVVGLKSAADLEQVKISFQSLTGSVAAGNAQFAALQKFAAATPFEFSDLTTSAKRFDAFAGSVGLSQAQLVPFLSTIGDLVSETGGGAQSLDSISLALGQTASQGKITLGNLNQINNAIPGFNSVAAIAAQRGESTAQAMQEISKGAISASVGIPQLLKGMKEFPGAAGAMQKQSETLLGVFSTFQDTVSQTLAGAFAPVIPLIKDSLGQITPIVGQALSVLGPALGKLIATILPLLASLLQGIVPILTPVLDGLAQAFKIIGPVLAPLGDALGLILKALEPLVPVLATILVKVVSALTPVIAALAPVLVELVGPITDILTALMPLIPPLGDLLVAVVQLVMPFIQLQALISKFMTAKVLIPIVQLLVPLISGLAKVIGQVATWISKINWGEVGDAIANFAQKVGGFFAGLWTTISDFFTSLPGKVMSWLSSLPGILWNAATTAMHLFFYAIGFGIGLIIKEFISLPGQIWVLIKLLWSGAVALFTEWIPKLIAWVIKLGHDFGEWIGKMWTKAKASFMKGVDDLVDFARKLPGRVVDEVKKLPGQIWGAVKGAADWLFDTGKNIIKGLIGGIESMIGSAIDTIKGVMSDIWHGAMDALHMGSPSKLFMEIGHNVIAGYNIGVNRAAPTAVATTQDALTPSSALSSPAGGAGGGGVVFGAGAVQVVFAGVVPTQQEALQTGQAVGQGIAATLARTRVRNTVRTI